MPTFLDNSLGYLNNGWQQMYGQPAVGVAPATPVSNPPQAVATPVQVNPNVGGSSDMPQMIPILQLLSGVNPASNPNNPTPIAYNPEVGQPLGAGDGGGSGAGLLSGGGGFNLASFLQNLFGGGGPPQYSATANTPANLYSGGASGGGYNAPGGYYVGASPSPGISGDIYPNQAAATAVGDVGAGSGGDGGGGMSGGQMGQSILSGIGSGLSKAGQTIAADKATFTPPNIPLPPKAVFTPPSLSPNTQRSY